MATVNDVTLDITSVTHNNNKYVVQLYSKIYAKLCFGSVLKCSLSAHLMQVKLLLFTFYLSGRLHAVSIRNRLN